MPLARKVKRTHVRKKHNASKPSPRVSKQHEWPHQKQLSDYSGSEQSTPHTSELQKHNPNHRKRQCESSRAWHTFDLSRKRVALMLRQRSLAFLGQGANLHRTVTTARPSDKHKYTKVHTHTHTATQAWGTKRTAQARATAKQRQLTMTGSSRRSVLVPTKMMGALGAWWRSSGIHFADTFSYDVGDTTEKQTRNTSVMG
jgi:hypothetical protein